jgi:hypothetical protein
MVQIRLLNSTNNTVLKFSNGSLDDVVELNEIPAIRIASAEGDLFVLGSDLTVNRFGSSNSVSMELSDVLGEEAVTDFKAIDDSLYLTTAEGDWGKTYKIPAGSPYGNLDNIQIIDGKFWMKTRLTVLNSCRRNDIPLVTPARCL